MTLNPYAIGVPPLSYQWQLNGHPLAGATTSPFAIPKAGLADGGIYRSWLNPDGSAVSSNAPL